MRRRIGRADPDQLKEGIDTSKYSRHDLKTMRNQEVLLAALATCGYLPAKVEVHATPQTLYGHVGDKRADVAHIVIRRHNTGIGASNDVGFLKNADGTYTAIVSEYDRRNLMGGEFLARVQKAYAKLNADLGVKTVLGTITRLKRAQSIPANATVTIQTMGTARKIMMSCAT